MHKITFFKKKQNCTISKLFPGLKFKKNNKINHIKPLDKSEKFDLTFFDSIKYKSSWMNVYHVVECFLSCWLNDILMMNKIIRGSEKAVILQGEQFPTSLENYVDIYKKLQLVIKSTLNS